MGPDTLAKKALVWLANRTKRVSQHIALHNSERNTLAQGTRPWILRKAAHSVTIGGDRVAKKICEKTLKNFDSAILQRNGNTAFSRIFGRQIGRLPGQTAFCVIVDSTGKIVTGFAITAAQAASTTAAVLILSETLHETIIGMNRVDEEYLAKNKPREEGLVEKIADFFMSDLGNEPLNADEGRYLASSRYRTIMENQYMSLMQQIENRSIDGQDRRDMLAQFRDGVAGAVAPYVEDQG